METTHKYIPRIPQREDNLFVEEYYSGTDTKIYINNKQQAEISYINYSVNEQLKPIYGYASRTFDDMAVGNRIVTGVIKMPIKNPEEQASYDTVIGTAKTTVEKIEENNKLQKKNKSKVEWVNNSKSNNTRSNTYVSNEIFEYQNKLITLGYAPSTSGILDKDTKAALKKFQQDNNIPQVNYFNNDTKSEIDTKITLSKTTQKTVSAITNVYYGMSTSMGIVTVIEPPDKLYIINDLKNGFTQVKTMDGKDGYIETKRLEG